jgi:hypothetical protein
MGDPSGWDEETNMNKGYGLISIIIILLSILITSCSGLSSIPETSTPFPPTNSPTSTPISIPTNTPSPTNTPTPQPTSTPEYGEFQRPAPVGSTVIRSSDEGVKEEAKMDLEFTLLEVKRGNSADQLARSELAWLTYQPLIENQEYLAVKVQLDLPGGDPNREYRLNTSFHMTLRYEESGSDIWSVEFSNTIAEGYPPLSGSSWVFFLIREGSQPMLYFQPHLIISENFGYRDSGAYFDLSVE